MRGFHGECRKTSYVNCKIQMNDNSLLAIGALMPVNGNGDYLDPLLVTGWTLSPSIDYKAGSSTTSISRCAVLR